MERNDKRVMLGHDNVSIGTRYRTLRSTISFQKMLMVKLRVIKCQTYSKSSTIHCVLSISKLLSVNASLTLSKPDLLSILLYILYILYIIIYIIGVYVYINM